MNRFAFACRSTGGACEWALEADSTEAVLQRVAEHQKCAHHMAAMTEARRQAVTDHIRPV